MKRSSLLFASALLALAALLARQSTRANDGVPFDSTSADSGISTVVKLIDRIEALEKRIAALEHNGPLVRQADSREMPEPGQLDVIAPEKETSIKEDIGNTESHVAEENPARSVKTIPLPNHLEQDDNSQNTNGQRWQVRLLGHRKTSPSAVR